MSESVSIARELNLNSLEKTLVELHAVRRLEKSNLLLADESNKDAILRFITKLDGLIEKTEARMKTVGASL